MATLVIVASLFFSSIIKKCSVWNANEHCNNIENLKTDRSTTHTYINESAYEHSLPENAQRWETADDSFALILSLFSFGYIYRVNVFNYQLIINYVDITSLFISFRFYFIFRLFSCSLVFSGTIHWTIFAHLRYERLLLLLLVRCFRCSLLFVWLLSFSVPYFVAFRMKFNHLIETIYIVYSVN